MRAKVENRESQRTWLQKRCKALPFKRNGLLLGLWGEAGIGKTHAVQQLFSELSFQSLSVHASLDFGQCLLHLPRPSKLPEFCTRVIQNLQRHEFVEPIKIIDTIVAVLGGLAPVILHLEDIHEVSGGQLELVQELAVRITRSKGVGLLVTSRHLPPEPFEALRLESLNQENTKLLLETEFLAVLPSQALDWLFARTTGNPLFSLEFVRFLRQQGYLWNDGRQWRWHEPEKSILPITIEVLIEQSVLHLTKDTLVAQALYAKAMIPPDSNFDFWALVADLTPDQLLLARINLEQAGILVRDELRHPLFQEVTQQIIPSAQQKTLARRIIEALKDQPLARVGYLKMAELPEATQKEYLEQAIFAAQNNKNYSLAADLTLQALPFYHQPEQSNLAREMAHLVLPFQMVKAAALFAATQNANANDTFEWACVLAKIGQYTKAEQLLQSIPDQQQLLWLEHQVMIRSLAENAAEAVCFFERSPALQESRNARFWLLLASSLTTLSHFKKAAIILEKVLIIADQENHKADALLARGRLNTYLGVEHQDFTKALQIYKKLGDEQGIAFVLYRLGSDLYYSGAPRLAAENCQNAMNLFEKAGNQHYWTCAILTYAIYTELAQYQEAEQHLLETESHYARNQPTGLHIEVCNHLSYLYRGWDIPYAPMLALKFARKGLEVARAIQNPRLINNCLYQLSKSLTLFGNPTQGLVLADEALAMGNELNYPAMQNYPHHARYQALNALGRQPEATQALLEAEKRLRAGGSLPDANFYALEHECRNANYQMARGYLEELRKSESLYYANVALRLYPQLEHQISTISLPKKYLSALGNLRIENELIKGTKRKELFAVLLEARIAGRNEIRRLDLLDALYPNENEFQAAGALRKTIYQVRKSHGENTIITTPNGYALGEFSTDVEEFLSTKNTQLWTGIYLEGIAIKRDDSLRETLHQALIEQANQLLETDTGEAIRITRILLESDPYHLEAIRLWLQALLKNKNYKSLARAYEKTREQMKEIGEQLPLHWSDFLVQTAKMPVP